MNKGRIVVADDQPDVRLALSLLLKAEGHTVEDVGSPAALIEAVGRGADLVLMDLNYTRDTTSGAEGLDLLRRLHERYPLTPVIVMTAWGSIELVVEAMRQGARSFVLKPWDNGPLQQLVAAELGEAQRRQGPAPDAGGPRDLAVARRVQAELLPRTKPPLASLDYAGLCLQAGAVGGDLYDFLPLTPGYLGFVLADASGKGVGAALLMAHLQALLRSQAVRALDDLTGFLADVNAQFYATTAPEHFATLFFGVYDDAGLSPTAPAMGLLQDWRASAGELRVGGDDLLLVYSDGVTEAGLTTGQEFGDHRLAEALRARRALAPAELLPALVTAVEAFAGEAHADDLTLVALKGR